MTKMMTFVCPDNTATINCPGCKTVTQFSAVQYRKKKHFLKIRCKCNTVFTVQLDFRCQYRKQISLPGTYSIVDPPRAGGGVIHIRNISRSGIGFTVSGKHNIRKNQTLHLEFRLNDKNMTKLIKQAKIQSVSSNYIGCQFIEQDILEKALGFYLRR